MLEAILLICAAMALAFAINLAPAFMPSTWMVMAFFYIRFDLPLLVLTLGSAIASALGRMVLAWGSHAFSGRFMPGQRQDLDELGAFLDEHRPGSSGVDAAQFKWLRADGSTATRSRSQEPRAAAKPGPTSWRVPRGIARRTSVSLPIKEVRGVKADPLPS